MSELLYCPTDEDCFSDLQGAIEFIGDVACSEKDAIGWVINVCKKIQPEHYSFINSKDLIGEMQVRASDEFSEWASDYLNDIEFDKEKIKSLDKLLKSWFDENAKQPNFYQAGQQENTIIVDKKLLNKYGICW